jgi:hypothetical protein
VVIDRGRILVLPGFDTHRDRATGREYLQQRPIDLLFDSQYQRETDAARERTIPESIGERQERRSLGGRGMQVDHPRVGAVALQLLPENNDQLRLLTVFGRRPQPGLCLLNASRAPAAIEVPLEETTTGLQRLNVACDRHDLAAEGKLHGLEGVEHASKRQNSGGFVAVQSSDADEVRSGESSVSAYDAVACQPSADRGIQRPASVRA